MGEFAAAAPSTKPPINAVTVAVVLWEDQPELTMATIGRSVRTLKRWSAEEGLTVHTRGRGTGSKDFWLLDEVLAFLKATSKTNHERIALRDDDND